MGDLVDTSGDAKPGGKWKPGQSGNPAGRKPSRILALWRKKSEAFSEEAVDLLIRGVRDGDPPSMKIFWDRCVPPLRPVEMSAEVQLKRGQPPTIENRTTVIIDMVLSGALSATTAGTILEVMGSARALTDLEALKQSVADLQAAKQPGRR